MVHLADALSAPDARADGAGRRTSLEDDDVPTLPSGFFRRGNWDFGRDFYDLQEIGKGKDTVIYSALSSRLPGRRIALKVYDRSRVSEGKTRAIRREAAVMRWATRLGIPRCCALYGAFEDELRYGLVMEHCDNGDLLEDLLAQRGEPWGDEARIAKEVLGPMLETLAALHARRVVHRDVKLENVFLNVRGECVLGDFGLALSLRTERPISPVGTVEYMAPEIVALPSADRVSRGEVDAATLTPTDSAVDIWALGVTVYELATGRLPFEGRDRAEIRRRIAAYKLAPFGRHVEPGFERFIRAMLTYDARDRPSAVELLTGPFMQQYWTVSPDLAALVPPTPQRVRRTVTPRTAKYAANDANVTMHVDATQSAAQGFADGRFFAPDLPTPGWPAAGAMEASAPSLPPPFATPAVLHPAYQHDMHHAVHHAASNPAPSSFRETVAPQAAGGRDLALAPETARGRAAPAEGALTARADGMADLAAIDAIHASADLAALRAASAAANLAALRAANVSATLASSAASFAAGVADPAHFISTPPASARGDSSAHRSAQPCGANAALLNGALVPTAPVQDAHQTASVRDPFAGFDLPPRDLPGSFTNPDDRVFAPQGPFSAAAAGSDASYLGSARASPAGGAASPPPPSPLSGAAGASSARLLGTPTLPSLLSVSTLPPAPSAYLGQSRAYTAAACQRADGGAGPAATSTRRRASPAARSPAAASPSAAATAIARRGGPFEPPAVESSTSLTSFLSATSFAAPAGESSSPPAASGRGPPAAARAAPAAETEPSVNAVSSVSSLATARGSLPSFSAFSDRIGADATMEDVAPSPAARDQGPAPSPASSSASSMTRFKSLPKGDGVRGDELLGHDEFSLPSFAGRRSAAPGAGPAAGIAAGPRSATGAHGTGPLAVGAVGGAREHGVAHGLFGTSGTRSSRRGVIDLHVSSSSDRGTSCSPSSSGTSRGSSAALSSHADAGALLAGTPRSPCGSAPAGAAQASPRSNVVLEVRRVVKRMFSKRHQNGADGNAGAPPTPKTAAF